MCGFETNRIVSLGAIFEVALTANQDIRRDICFSSQIPADVGIIEALLAGIIGNHDKQIPVTVLSVGSFRAASKEPNGIRLNIFLNLIDKRLNWSEVNWVQLNLMKRRGLRPLFLRN
jgi:hypothetical protein